MKTAEAAATSEANAKTSETHAQTSETNAKASEVAAAVSAAQATELGLYQQALRDITKTYSNAQTVVWPQAPAWIGA